MNGVFYNNPSFPTNNENKILKTPPGNISVQDSLSMEQSFIENILRLNVGKKVKAYVSYPDSSAWQNKVYDGILEQAGRDHLIIKDISSGSYYLIRIIYLNYVEFDEKINYTYPYA